MYRARRPSAHSADKKPGWRSSRRTVAQNRPSQANTSPSAPRMISRAGKSAGWSRWPQSWQNGPARRAPQLRHG